MNYFFIELFNIKKSLNLTFCYEFCFIKWSKQRKIYRNISTLLLKPTYICAILRDFFYPLFVIFSYSCIDKEHTFLFLQRRHSKKQPIRLHLWRHWTLRQLTRQWRQQQLRPLSRRQHQTTRSEMRRRTTGRRDEDGRNQRNLSIFSVNNLCLDPFLLF